MREARLQIRIAVALLSAAAGLSVGVPGAIADTVHVQNTHDSGPGSLRDAMDNANSGDVIVVPAGTYVLRSGELFADIPLEIRGAGAARTILDARGDSRVFDFQSGADPLKISGVTITGGRNQYGGGIRNEGSLTLSRTVLEGNRAAGETFNAGGAISTIGTLKIVRSILRDNHTSRTAEGFGGAIDAGSPDGRSGSISIFHSRLAGNSAPFDGFGGAIAWQTNDVSEDVGLKVVATTLAGNTAIGGNNFGASGGAILFNPYVNDPLTVALDIRRSTFDGNRAFNESGTAYGGALYVPSRSNVPGADTPTTLVNDTFTDNSAGGHGSNGLGGAALIDAQGSTGASVSVDITNSTIARNAALGDGGEGGGIYSTGNGVTTVPPIFVNTIVALNAAASGRDCQGGTGTSGHNIERHESCGFVSGGDQQNTAPGLAPLADNGGPTRTMALEPGSPARNHGDDDRCPNTDQRGVHRPQGAHCDVGAFEAKVR